MVKNNLEGKLEVSISLYYRPLGGLDWLQVGIAGEEMFGEWWSRRVLSSAMTLLVLKRICNAFHLLLHSPMIQFPHSPSATSAGAILG